MPFVDDFLLGRSSPFDLATSAEQDVDLTLQPNPDVNAGAVIGNVLFGATAVPNAVVKLLTTTGDPVAHQTTNSDGFFVMTDIAPGPYQIVAIATGFAVSPPTAFTLAPRQARFINISLTTDPRTQLSTLFGLVRNQVTGARLASATVLLTSGTPVAETLTNADGQFLLCALGNGSYLISAAKSGFEAMTPIAVSLTGPSIVRSDLYLVPEVIPHGTVSGSIRDPGGAAIANAFVGLYTVSGATETLSRGTFTNSSGLYLFEEVPAGRYLVKAIREILGDPPLQAEVVEIAG